MFFDNKLKLTYPEPILQGLNRFYSGRVAQRLHTLEGEAGKYLGIPIFGEKWTFLVSVSIYIELEGRMIVQKIAPDETKRIAMKLF